MINSNDVSQARVNLEMINAAMDEELPIGLTMVDVTAAQYNLMEFINKVEKGMNESKAQVPALLRGV